MALCQSLASIGKRGTTVLLSIHQPRADIFSLFDRVVVLCEGGRVVFEGSPNMVPAYLQRALTLNLCPNLPKVRRENLTIFRILSCALSRHYFQCCSIL
jgi:ABC-type multidrug transport system ATPase subunit